MSADGPAPVDGALIRRPHHVLVAERRARGWGRGRLAVEFERAAGALGLRTPERAALMKAIYRHETGRAEVRDELYVQLYCAVFELGRHELIGPTQAEPVDRAAYELTSHKFVPIHLGGRASAAALAGACKLTPGTTLELDCWRGSVPHPAGTAQLFVFPWGVACFHLAESLSVPSLSAVAAWRQSSYPLARAWATGLVSHALDVTGLSARYVMSGYWLDTPQWSEPTLGTAMRLLAMPRVLLGRPDVNGQPSMAHAEHAERALLRDGFHDSRIESFGIQGVSVGYVTWGGVAYSPLSADRALRPADLIELETVVQALWCFCHDLREQVERGNDPVPTPGYGWRWLRGVRSRLTAARPDEGGQHAAFRESVLAASGLADHLSDAVEALRDTDRNAS